MRLIFAGTPEAAIPTLAALVESRHEIVGVFSQPDRPQGRGRAVLATPVAKFAREHDLPLHQPIRINAEAPLIADLAPDAAVVVAYGALIKPELLQIPRIGWINLHFSLLPAFRGAAPVQHALLAGETITGATTFLLDEGMDTGPVLGHVTEAIRPEDTTGSLLERLSVSGAQLLVATLRALEDGTATAVPQAGEGASTAPKLNRAQARIEWNRSGRLLDRHIRAMTPEPGAWTLFHDMSVIIEQAVFSDSDLSLDSGVLAVAAGRVLVGTADAPLELLRVRPAGKRSMLAADWVRGIRGEIVFS